MSRLLFRPPLHMRFQHTQRHRALLKHGIVKFAHIEFRAELFLRFRAQLAIFSCPNL